MGYSHGDIVTYYFILMNDDFYERKRIQAWTDDKELAKMYYRFHKCSNYEMKTITKDIDDIRPLLEENYHEEIKLYNILVRDPDHKKGKNGMKTIVIPATQTEATFISEEISTFMASRINYGYINEALPYFKDKYQHALDKAMLTDIIGKVVYNRPTKITEAINFDQLMVLLASFPDHFGA